ncbi:MAG TPA: AI-2E family transporter [Xanthobacteraceae bacterium]|jgi:predicted PurR-regulated permease PerM
MDSGERSKSYFAEERLNTAAVEIAIRLAALGLLLYWTIILVRPFLTILLWSVVLAVALYPVFDWVAARLGGRRSLAAAIITVAGVLIILGPAAWLGLGLMEGARFLSDRLGSGALSVPEPPEGVRHWPLIGGQAYRLWSLASMNLKEAFDEIAPYLKPYSSTLLGAAAGASTGLLKFFVSVIVAGFLFSPGPSLVNAVKAFSRHLESSRGGEFVDLAGATIRSVSRGVIGISLLQAFAAGVGLWLAGVPGASVITFAVLIFGIVQIGPSLILIPVIVWSWFRMETMTALMFTAYMGPVNLLDNILRPIVMGRGLATPMPVIFIGVVGGTLVHGLIGLFIGPIVLAVAWELLRAWIRDVRSGATEKAVEKVYARPVETVEPG